MVACALRLHPASSGSGVWYGRACWGLGFGCAPSLLWGGVGVCVCSCARPVWSPAPPGWGCCAMVCVCARALLVPAFPGWGVLCGRACWVRVSAMPRSSWLGRRGVFFLFLSRFGFVVLVAGCSCSGSCGPCLPILSLFGWVARSFLFFFRPSVVCVCASWVSHSPGGPLLLAWCCRLWLCPFGGPVIGVFSVGDLAAPCGVGGRFAGCGPIPRPPPPPPFFFMGWGCLSLPLPSQGWRTHWLAFCVVFRVAVAGCALLGRVPAPWVGWVMYTLGSAPLPAGLGPGSAGWAAAPGGFVWLWVRGLGWSVSFLLRGAGFNLLGGQPPLLPGAWWPRVWPAVLVSGVLVRRLPGCAVACFG